jgi:hypothetical protein
MYTRCTRSGKEGASMKSFVGTLAVLLIPALASAQGGVVGVYADPASGYCLVTDTPGQKTLYVMHKFTVGSVSSHFRVELSAGFTGALTSWSAPGGTLEGDLLTGATVTYDECTAGSFIILELQFMMFGTSDECSWVRIAADPASVDGMVDVYNCELQRTPAAWTGTHVQHDPFLFCPDLTVEDHTPPSCLPFTPPLAVESATWGAVKALYR